MMMSLFLAAYFAVAAQTDGRTVRIVSAPDSPVRLESASVLNSGSRAAGAVVRRHQHD